MRTKLKTGISLYLLLFCGVTSSVFSDSKTIRFTLEPERDDIIQYEMELWKGTSFDLEIPFRVVSNPGKIQLHIPDGYEYFRIRAVAKRQVRGFWTDLFEVNSFGKSKPKEVTKAVPRKTDKTDVLVPIPTKEGTNHFFLTENKIQVRPLAKEKIKTSVRYRINHGPWKVTGVPELSFSKDGDYRLEYQVTNELGVSDSMQIWDFSVDNTPPNTELHFEPITHRNKGKYFISSRTALQVQSDDNGSGVDTIRFRSRCGTGVRSDWYLWDPKSSWTTLIQSCSKDLEVEISATDRLGNEEIPKIIRIQKPNPGN
ncbi:hypothetical protein JWG41_02680 [Leptospira sp. 201903075]|uniref:LBF_2017 N-terminal domain-containing protein n=1 Tax=Leptospira chreensis TaxID=2810035 RepID=UPI001964DE36|nr:hypothetical protein [Leptospira chreensis]MBM9589335.1 hypothetical protein [Leptospira chreensis]